MPGACYVGRVDEGLQKIVSLAWRTVPAVEANQAILRARAATAAGEEALEAGALDEGEDEGSEALARSYELVLDPDATFAGFAEKTLPRLVYHLESIRAFLPGVEGVVVCIFEGDRLHFLHGGEFLGEICRQLGVTPEELSARYGTGELRTAVAPAGPPLALPGPKS